MSQQASNVAVIAAPVSDEATIPAPSPVAYFSQVPTDALPADYVENDPAQRSAAQIAHVLGIFGILGTGIYYLVKKNDPAAAKGTFLRDQMCEAFNFHLCVFASVIAINILTVIVAVLFGALASVVSLLAMVVSIGALVLTIINALKAGKGQVARYPARIAVLK